MKENRQREKQSERQREGQRESEPMTCIRCVGVGVGGGIACDEQGDV